MQAIEHGEARRLLLGCLGASYGLMALALAISDVSANLWSMSNTLFVIGFLLVSPYAVALGLGFRRVATTLEATIVSSLVMFPIVTWTYVAIGAGFPLADGKLAAMDAALGFDWRGFIAFIDERRLLAKILGYCYASFIPQCFLFTVYFCVTGRPVRAYAAIFGFALLSLMSSIVSVWFPATGTFVFYGVGEHDTININAKAAYSALGQFLAVHGQPGFVLDFDATAGILTFPSVHVGAAVLFAWIAWSSRTLRYPALILNIGMTVSTVPNGSHYLVDVIAGIGVAGLTIAITTAAFYRPAPGQSAVFEQAAAVLGRIAGPRREADGRAC